MKVAVASGKGGTGKTLVATSLALAADQASQIVDCDVEEPNAHLLLHPTIIASYPVSLPVPMVDHARCNFCGLCADVCAFNAMVVLKGKVLIFPWLCHGCGACEHLCPGKCITEEPKRIGTVESGRAGSVRFIQGRMDVGEALAPPVIRAAKEQAEGPGLVIMDCPPGTSCPVVEAIRGSDYCLLVTEPTPFGLHDLTLALETVRLLGVPCGVVINRSSGDDGQVDVYCAEHGLPILMRIPLGHRDSPPLRARGDAGGGQTGVAGAVCPSPGTDTPGGGPTSHNPSREGVGVRSGDTGA